MKRVALGHGRVEAGCRAAVGNAPKEVPHSLVTCRPVQVKDGIVLGVVNLACDHLGVLFRCSAVLGRMERKAQSHVRGDYFLNLSSTLSAAESAHPCFQRANSLIGSHADDPYSYM